MGGQHRFHARPQDVSTGRRPAVPPAGPTTGTGRGGGVRGPHEPLGANEPTTPPGKVAHMTEEERRLQRVSERTEDWKRWGPYLSDRAGGTVRGDYSSDW